ncbi:uncharacterized protein LOC110429427 [Herrania umbratica]|uniref:Uncharacterized protein LOC110429427 n=1 Tax=Herrania umbratica TaxID=108875 RepID=A0A6J1BPB8_9ROSI|nr:uncharacterized protein LOC110429427 [Herrania umbratica]
MPAESLKSEKSNPIPMAAWPTLIKCPPNGGEEFMKAKKNVMATKASLESKKSCICSPTSHAGSFRCHLHRATAATQNSSFCSMASASNKLKGAGGQPVLSRLGRASSPKLKPVPESSLPGQ